MKGQTAIEYLMTYGWAILIILIVAGVLAYYGIFAPSGFLGQSVRGFTTVQVLQPWSLSQGGVFTANLENRVGSDISVSHIYIMSTDGAAVGHAVPTTPANPTNFTPAEKKIVTFSTGLTGTPGQTFTYTVSIEYGYGSTPTYFNSTGTVSGTFS